MTPLSCHFRFVYFEINLHMAAQAIHKTMIRETLEDQLFGEGIEEGQDPHLSSQK